MIQDPRKNPDRHQNLNDWSRDHASPLQKISSKSVYNFWQYFAHRHTHGHTESDEYSTSSADVNINTYFLFGQSNHFTVSDSNLLQ